MARTLYDPGKFAEAKRKAELIREHLAFMERSSYRCHICAGPFFAGEHYVEWRKGDSVPFDIAKSFKIPVKVMATGAILARVHVRHLDSSTFLAVKSKIVPHYSPQT